MPQAASFFSASCEKPDFITVDSPVSADGVDGAVYQYVGSENIYQTMLPYGPAVNSSGSLLQPGPRRLWEDDHQSSFMLQDRVQLPGRIQLIAGGRYDSLRDHNYSAYASCSDFTVPGACDPTFTDKNIWLPQYAVTFNPIRNLTLYSNYGVLLSLGPQSPFWTDNDSQFLSPYYVRQAEVGAKYEPGQRILLTTAFFHMRAPFFYPESDGVGGFNFVSQGRETHNGVELNAEGKAANWLSLDASAAAMNAILTDTGTPAYDNKQVINVPRLHSNVFADVAVPRMHGLHLMPGWSLTTRKEATRDDTVSVPSYNLFNLGARYTPGGEKGRVTFHIFANNIANKRYWSDTGADYGDTFVWLGAPHDRSPLCALHVLTAGGDVDMRTRSSAWSEPEDPCCHSTPARSNRRNIFKKPLVTMTSTAKAHGMDGSLVPSDWPPLTLDEVRALLSRFPALGEPTRILTVSPRPFSAAGTVATSNGPIFIKRHHRAVRDREGLLEEHLFLAHLAARGAAVPRVLSRYIGRNRHRDGRVVLRSADPAPRHRLVRRRDLLDALSHDGARIFRRAGARPAASRRAGFCCAGAQASPAGGKLHHLRRARSHRSHGALPRPLRIAFGS